jgi:MFS family permease
MPVHATCSPEPAENLKLTVGVCSIVFRALQGIGASAYFSISLIMSYELVPEHKYALFISLGTIGFAVGLALGPILGGIITNSSWTEAWRWVFLLNLPVSAIIFAALFFTLPPDFPYQGMTKKPKPAPLASIDFLGTILLIAALILTLVGLEQAVSDLNWITAKTLAPLCIAVLLWAAFLASQYWVTKRGGIVEPIFPWRFIESRAMIGMILNQFVAGGVGITSYYSLPLHWQITTGCDPLIAGLRMLPMAGCVPLGLVVCAGSVKNQRVPPVYIGILGGVLLVVGLAVLSTGPTDSPPWFERVKYGLEVIIGFGFGLCVGLASLLSPFLVEKRDMAVATGLMSQARFLGGAVVVAIITAVGNTYASEHLMEEGTLSPEQVESLFLSTAVISTLPEEIQTTVRNIFVAAFNIETRIMLGFAVVSVLSCALMWQRPNIRVP